MSGQSIVVSTRKFLEPSLWRLGRAGYQDHRRLHLRTADETPDGEAIVVDRDGLSVFDLLRAVGSSMTARPCCAASIGSS
jgi:hypothetical protein